MLRTSLLLLCLLIPTSVMGQSSRGDRGGSGERSSDRGDRGSDRGGDRSSRGEGDRGDRGDRGGRSFGGGFPGGGFPGGGFGGPPGGGFGGPFGGGPPGGGFGGPFGGGGGMSDMVRRFDRNANNMIEPEEAQGPAGYFLQRMAQNNPKIDLSKPISVETIVAEMDKMRGGRGGESSGGSNNSDSGSAQKNEPKLLVPDFKLTEELPAVPGFGIASDKPNIEVTDRDRSEAEERIRRYDRDNDKILNAEEIAQGRWSDDVMQYDRNKDGKLSVEEFAVRQAARRQSDEGQSGNAGGSSGWGGWGGGNSSGWSRGDDRNGGESAGWSRGGDVRAEAKKDEPKRFGDAKSYRLNSSAPSVSGLPSFFTTSDINADSQVTLSEFAGTLTETALAEFQQWDMNGDGIITARECQAAVKAGVQVGGGGSNSSAGSSKGATLSNSAPKAGSYSEADLEWAKKQVAKYDNDGDGSLSKSESGKMLVPPKGADVNNDGKISAEEYAAFRVK